jgi:hypothetical protein
MKKKRRSSKEILEKHYPPSLMKRNPEYLPPANF